MYLRRLFLLSFLICSSSLTFAQDDHWVFTYEEGGGLPGSTHLIVKVSDDGTFSASSEGLPIIESGLTKHEFSKLISNEEVSHFVELARAAKDFVINPEKPWPDCKRAEMMVIKMREKMMRRSGCMDKKWSERRHTKRLLARIESHLPSEMHDRP